MNKESVDLSALLHFLGSNTGESGSAGWRFQRLGRAESRNLTFLRTSTRKIRDHFVTGAVCQEQNTDFGGPMPLMRYLGSACRDP